jgi:hypothetical protein
MIELHGPTPFLIKIVLKKALQASNANALFLRLKLREEL